MTQEHPITPPPELVENWTQTDEDERFDKFYKRICTQAARWGADQELEACCEWLVAGPWFSPDGECIKDLRAARRPKPPSLKEQALEALDRMDQLPTAEDHGLIRRALESLPD